MSNDSDGGRQRNWILSFADLLSLLLCFMVMSFAVSKVERDQRHQPAPATETISETTGWPARGQPSADAPKPTRVLDLDYLAAVLGAIIARDRVLQETHIERSDDRLVLAIPGDILFAPGETRIADEARPSFDALARVLDSVSNPIGVFGHAHRQPLPTGDEYAMDWELSLGRALAVGELLAQSGLARPVACYGLADIPLNGLRENSERLRRPMARGVDLVVYASVGR